MTTGLAGNLCIINTLIPHADCGGHAFLALSHDSTATVVATMLPESTWKKKKKFYRLIREPSEAKSAAKAVISGAKAHLKEWEWHVH